MAVYYKQNATYSKKQADFAACDERAEKLFPPDIHITYTRGKWTTRYGRCRTTGGVRVCQPNTRYWTPGYKTETDNNEKPREKERKQCIAQKGYKQVKLSRCKSTGKSVAVTKPETVFPNLQKNSCARESFDFGWVIVNP